jgi:5-methylcytosine-specific restriction endonuclease McrA
VNATDRLVKRIEDALTVEAVHAIIDEYRAGRAKAKRAKGERLRSRPRSEPSRKEAKEAKRTERNASTSEVRLAVWARASGCWGHAVSGRCECGCGQTIFRETFHMDHWIGGSSRRKETTVANCWALHPNCDHDKTNAGGPGSSALEFWNERRRFHCEKHGLPFVPRKPTRYYAKETP